jgi:hypothetical protein
MEDQPTVVTYWPHGTVMRKEWHKDNNKNKELHRENAPAVVDYFRFGGIKEETWFKDNNYYREDGPVVVMYFSNGKIKEEDWINVNDEFHRDDGPAIIKYFEEGIKKSETWYKEDKIHREDGPAFVKRDRLNNKTQKYYREGKLHKFNGPAVIKYNKDGTVTDEEYWFNGTRYDSKDAYDTRLSLGIFKEPFNTNYKKFLRGVENTYHSLEEEPFTEEEIEEQLQAFREEIKDNEIQRLKDAQKKFPNQEFVEFRVI